MSWQHLLTIVDSLRCFTSLLQTTWGLESTKAYWHMLNYIKWLYTKYDDFLTSLCCSLNMWIRIESSGGNAPRQGRQLNIGFDMLNLTCSQQQSRFFDLCIFMWLAFVSGALLHSILYQWCDANVEYQILWGRLPKLYNQCKEGNTCNLLLSS